MLDADSYIIQRTVISDVEGNPVKEMVFSDVRMNVELDPGLFHYTPPPGAKFTSGEEEYLKDLRALREREGAK